MNPTGRQITSAVSLAAMNWGQHEIKRLIRFKPGNGNSALSWEGRGEDMTTKTAGTPVTDRSWWEGRWVLCPLTLKLTGGEAMEIGLAVASVSRERRIVSTALTGRDGTVKEYINEGDWSVSLTLELMGEDGEDEWPGDKLTELRKILEAKERIEVASEFLKVFDITHVVVKSWSVMQETEWNAQTVTVSAVSDEDYEIYSNDY